MLSYSAAIHLCAVKRTQREREEKGEMSREREGRIRAPHLIQLVGAFNRQHIHTLGTN